MQGVPMKVIADQLGHTDTRMTERSGIEFLSPSGAGEGIRLTKKQSSKTKRTR